MKRRPAETSAAAAAAAAILARALGVDDPDTILAMAVLIGAVPGVVTFIVVTLRRLKTSEPGIDAG
jgi:mannose/fructose/N-acetylgalactosamine-specific phosphotransferase system component IIC